MKQNSLRRKALAVLLSAAMLMSVAPCAVYAAQEPDGGTVHVYAPTGDDPATEENESPDTLSTKYQVSVNETEVPAIKYNAQGQTDMDIARFASDSRTPQFEITLLNNETIQNVQVYPERYYPQEALTVSEDKKTVRFRMSDKLAYAIVYINGTPANQAGKPYLTLINDPLEDEAAKPKADDPNVLNFKEFSEQYLLENPITDTVGEVCREAGQVQDYSNNNGTLYTLNYDTGYFVDYDAKPVSFPNKRARLKNDVSDALQAALEEIKNTPELDTLYIPAGTYIWSGLRILNWNGDVNQGGKPLTIYTEEGALLENRRQECKEAIEPAILISQSSYVTVSGRGIFDGKGFLHSVSDTKNARETPHQGGSMLFYSNNITFNDTYVRDAKQWNWECHTVEDIYYNNIKGLSPYNHAWVDGLDLTSGKNVYVNGAITLGNDDCFASGHYNPSDEFPRRSISENRFTETIGAAAYYYNKDRLNWDTENSENIVVTNSMHWTRNIANGIRTGHNTWGKKLLSYTFDNFNPMNYPGTGIRIQNANMNSYPDYKQITVKNSSFTSSGSGDWASVPTSTRDLVIPQVTLDNCWFTNPNAMGTFQSITDFTVNNLYIGGELVQYSNQSNMRTSNIGTFTFTANGKDVVENSIPRFVSPGFNACKAYSNNPLSFKVEARDEDEGDIVTLEAEESTLPEGAVFNVQTGVFFWKPAAEEVGNEYTVTFKAYDNGARDGVYDPAVLNVKITVASSENTTQDYYVSEDTTLQTWKTEKTQNFGTTLFLTTRLINNSSGPLGEKYNNTSTGATDDGKLSLLKFDLSTIKEHKDSFREANLVLTYLGNRSASGTNTLKVAVAGSEWQETGVTFNDKPTIVTDGEGAVKQSASFDVGTVQTDKNNPYRNIDGRKITIDITDFVKAALDNNQDSLSLAVNEAKSQELYFATREGAANQRKPELAPVISLTIPTEIEVEGPDSMTLPEGYKAVSSDSFFLKGVQPITMTKLSGDDKITWNSETYCLDIAEGLAPGEYPVVLEAANADGQKAQHTFTLTVELGKSGLQALYDENKDREQKGYTDETWQALQSALGFAKEVLEAPSPTQEQLKEALSRLQAALDGLICDKTVLQDLVNKAQSFVDNGKVATMIKTAREIYLSTLAKAKEVLTDDSATYEEVMDIQTKLSVCITSVTLQAGDKKALRMLIESADYYTDEVLKNYFDEGQDAFKTAREEAKAVYADGDAFEETVQAAYDKLFETMTSLRMKPDKSSLKALIDMVNGLNPADYTAKSFAVLREAVLAAQAVYDDGLATEAQVKAAQKVLESAYDNLVKASSEEPGGDDEPGGDKEPGGSDTPATGSAVPMPIALLLLVSGASLLVLRRKEKSL